MLLSADIAYSEAPSLPAAPATKALAALQARAEEWEHVLERCLEQRVHTLVPPPAVPVTHRPLWEEQQWQLRARTLSAVMAQLQEPAVQECIAAMSAAELPAAATLRDLARHVARARAEATWNAKYLGVLHRPFELLAGGDARAIACVLPGAASTLRQVATLCRAYSTRRRMVRA